MARRPFFQTFRFITLIALWAAGTWPAGAVRAEGELPYANELRDARDHIENAKQRIALLEGEYGKYGEFTAADLAAMRQDYAPMLEAWGKVVAAFEGGQPAEARAMRAEAIKAEPEVNWWDRLAKRERQAQAAPTERLILGEVYPYASASAKPLAEAWIESKKVCSEAWGRLADAMAPGADPRKLIELHDRAYAADVYEETAGLRFQWVNTVERGILWDKAATSPELARVLEELRQVGEKRIALRLEQIERARQGRELERRQKELEVDVRKAFEAARVARAEALRVAHEEAERKAREAREEAQRVAREEAQRRAKEEAERKGKT